MTKVSSEQEVADFVAQTRESRTPFEIVGGGTRRRVGRPMGDLPLLDVSGLSGIVKYEPEELIVTVKPGTPLTEIKAVLAEKNQCLGFDPVDWKCLSAPGTATIGGAISADASGSGRLRHGAARDSLLAFRAVNGLGETFRAGGKVVKNVTGFDLSKLMCGAFGTLGVLSELTFRVYPKARDQRTLCLMDVDAQAGFAALRKIWQSALEPTGLAYIPGSARFSGLRDTGKGAALIRFEGAPSPLAEKIAATNVLIGATREIENGAALFAAIGEGALFAAPELDIWRIAVTPTEAAHLAQKLCTPLWLGDWAGGLIWAALPGDAAPRARVLAAEAGGHAMLLRAPAERRTALGLYPPQSAALQALTRSVQAAFDPLHLFNPGRL